jgi:hypothetical protein
MLATSLPVILAARLRVERRIEVRRPGDMES